MPPDTCRLTRAARAPQTYRRYTDVAPIRLVVDGRMAAFILEDHAGEVFAVYAARREHADDGARVAAAHAAAAHAAAAHAAAAQCDPKSAELIGVLDTRRPTFAVRDVRSPLGQAAIAWLLLRGVGMDATGIKFRGA